MRYIVLLMLVVLVSTTSCKEEKDPRFLVSPNQVGHLTDETRFAQVATLYQADSVILDTLNLNFGKVRQQIRIYEKGGSHLLTLTPSDDSLKTISNIRILDPRFTTPEGINLNSTFKDIEAVYPIKKVVTALANVVLILKDSPIYITMDKSQLPENLRYSDGPVEAVQIPDNAKIKYLMVDWD